VKRQNISRLERGTSNSSLRFLRRVVVALGAEVEVRFKLLEAADG